MVGRTLGGKNGKKEAKKEGREEGKKKERLHLQSKSCIQIQALPLTTYAT